MDEQPLNPYQSPNTPGPPKKKLFSPQQLDVFAAMGAGTVVGALALAFSGLARWAGIAVGVHPGVLFFVGIVLATVIVAVAVYSLGLLRVR